LTQNLGAIEFSAWNASPSGRGLAGLRMQWRLTWAY